jgi:hypothetical protein
VSRGNGRSARGRARLEPVAKILHVRAAAPGVIFGVTVAHDGDICIVTTPPLRLSCMLFFGAPDMAHDEAGVGWKGQPVELDARVDLETELGTCHPSCLVIDTFNSHPDQVSEGGVPRDSSVRQRDIAPQHGPLHNLSMSRSSSRVIKCR